jgi:predicted phosphoribosyltransferase/dienelactone hydrolase
MFRDRAEAGHRLAAALTAYRGTPAVVLAVPRGGVPVGFEVARELGLPLDVIVVRKLGVPSYRELAAGAIGEGGARVLNEQVVRQTGLSASDLASVEATARAELDARVRRFRRGRPPVPLRGRTALVVDDGVATGATAMAACEVARALGADRVVLAVPVASPRTVQRVRSVADDVVVLEQPEWFSAVGEVYDDFAQVPDDEVAALLHRSDAAPSRGAAPVPATDEEVLVPVTGAQLPGHLTVPAGAGGLVVFVHGSGSSRHSPRNRAVAHELNGAGLGTLLFDLLTEREGRERHLVFDINLLAGRLAQVTVWLRHHPGYGAMPLGFFGASTGAAAALVAATDRGLGIRAVVSRGGRPDLAREHLRAVEAPTLLVVGGADHEVLVLNRQAQTMIPGPTSLVVVPHATHLFEEPGALEEVARVATEWFLRHL